MTSPDSYDALNDEADNLGFSSFFNHLLNTKRSVDVTFLLETPDGEVEISAHQLVLAMRSAYFADEFYGDQKEKENRTFRLQNVNPKAFKDMIRYCYDCKPTLDTIEAISVLFGVAKQFEVMGLMNLCRTSLGDIKIEVRNVFSVLETAEYIEEKKVSHMCNKLIEEKTKKIMESYEMDKVTPAMIHIILQLPELFLHSEYELIKWIYEWVKIKSNKEDSEHKSNRECVEKLLKYLNFLALTSEEFLTLCKDFPDFLSPEEIVSFILNMAFPGSKDLPDWYDKDWKFREYIAEKTDKEIEEKQKRIALLTADKEALEEILEYTLKSEQCIKVWMLLYIQNPFLYDRIIRFPIFADEDKMERFKVMILKVASTEMIGIQTGTISEIAKEVFQETERGLNATKVGVWTLLDFARLIQKEPLYVQVAEEISGRQCKLQEMNSTLNDRIEKLSQDQNELEKRLRELMEYKFKNL